MSRRQLLSHRKKGNENDVGKRRAYVSRPGLREGAEIRLELPIINATSYYSTDLCQGFIVRQRFTATSDLKCYPNFLLDPNEASR